MARKCNLKKKPKSVLEAPAAGQESQKKASEVRGKKGFQQENQEDIPGHVLDRAFLVRVNVSWNGWQHQLMTVLVGGQGLALFHSGTMTPPAHPKLLE